MPPRFTPLEAPDLTQQDDLLPYVFSTIQTASQGALNDFSPHSPIAALAEGLDFPIRELRYAMNRMAFTVAINHLKTAGVQRRLGDFAKVTLTFTLSSPLATPFTLSAGYMVSTGNSLEFFTEEMLIIPAGAISGQVRAIAAESGTPYNVAAYTITRLSETRAFLKAVTNTEPAQGGLNEETQEEVLSRGFAALRYRNVLITEDDFEQEAIRILGTGAIAKAVGLLSADKQSKERGAVHLFVLNPDGTAPNDAQLSDIQIKMRSQFPAFLQENRTTTITSGLYVSEIALYPLELYVIASLVAGDNPEVRAIEINAQLQEYLKPGNLALGETVVLKELENVVRQSGVRYVQSVTSHVTTYVGQSANVEIFQEDIPLPFAWSASFLLGSHIEVVDVAGKVFEYSFGNGGDKD